MQPLAFELGSVPIYSVVLSLLAFTVLFLPLLWHMTRKSLKNDAIYDIAFLCLISGAIFGRVVALLEYSYKYRDIGFSVMPIVKEGEAIRYFTQWPWLFFKVSDTNVSFLGFALGIIVALIIVFYNSNRQKSIYFLFDKVLRAYAVASIVMLIGLFMAGTDLGKLSNSPLAVSYPDEVKRIAPQIIQLGYIFVFIAISIYMRMRNFKQGIISAVFLIIVGVGEILTRFFTEDYNASFANSFDFQQVLAIIMAVGGIFLLISITQTNIYTSVKSRQQSRTAKYNRDQDAQNYRVSFGKGANTSAHSMTAHEKLTKTINTLKRKIAK